MKCGEIRGIIDSKSGAKAFDPDIILLEYIILFISFTNF